LQIVANNTQSLSITYKSHLDEYIGYQRISISEIQGYNEKTISDLSVGEIISINLTHIGSRKMNAFAKVIDNNVHEMKPKIIIVITHPKNKLIFFFLKFIYIFRISKKIN
jgi:hypothetical protein